LRGNTVEPDSRNTFRAPLISSVRGFIALRRLPQSGAFLAERRGETCELSDVMWIAEALG